MVDSRLIGGEQISAKKAKALMALSAFPKESDLCDYIELNIELFSSQCLGIEYGSHQREYRVGGTKATDTKRVDFFILSKDGKRFLVECKNPYYPYEQTSAIGQLLAYGAVSINDTSAPSNLVLVSSKFDATTATTINNYKLPIQYICLNKETRLIIKHEGKELE